MIALIVPHPVTWLEPVLAWLAPQGPTLVLAPWALPTSSALPAIAFVARRQLAWPQTVSQPAWPVWEAALAAWAGTAAHRQWRARFRLRASVDAWALRQLQQRPALRTVIAPTWTAQRSFRWARARGLSTRLIEDYPQLTQLNADLDQVARAHPTARLASRARASAAMCARQAAEQQLADERLPPQRWHPHLAQLAPASRPPRAAPLTSVRQVLLVGPALARSGSYEALAMLNAQPMLTLWYYAPEAVEPEALAAHPRARRYHGAPPWHVLEGAIAPAWCESLRPEIIEAAQRGLPIWATARAAAHLPRACWHELACGEVPAGAGVEV